MSRISVWKAYQSELPNGSSVLPLDMLRANLAAMHIATAVGISPQWNYTNSVTRGEAGGGTAEFPARQYWFRGTGNFTKWVRASLTYDLLRSTRIEFHYSDDNETTYVPMADPDRNHVLNMVWDSVGNLESTSWTNA